MQDTELKEEKVELQVQEFKAPSSGEYFTNLSFKDKAIVDLSAMIYQDSDLLDEAIKACEGDGRKQSMVEYVRTHFTSLLAKFPSIQEEYLANVRLKNAKLKKARRRKK
jgi:hypothetical protein